MELLDVEFPGTFAAYDGESAAGFLDRLRFPTRSPAPRAGGVRPQLLRRTRPSSPPASWSRCSTPTSSAPPKGCSSTCPVDDYDTALWAPLAATSSRSGSRSAPESGSSALDAPATAPSGSACGGDEIAASAVVVADRSGDHPRSAARQRASATRHWRARVAAMHRAAVRGLAALAGPAGRRRPAAVPGHQRLRPAGQRLGARTVRGRRPALGRPSTAARWSSCTRTH